MKMKDIDVLRRIDGLFPSHGRSSIVELLIFSLG
jgi:hypothetical protein